jgi:hypothetical protein
VGLKVDSSFLKFVTMGALGTRRVSELMVNAGLQPIELERYSRSNKIWATKVKRLRLPDLLCVRTGLRVEVRAKSQLAIKMSDAPTNPERRWNSGLVPENMIAFVLIREAEDGTLHAADNAEFFTVESLIATEANSKLGPAKSASEGAERDRQWPSTVATSNGVVQAVNQTRISVRLENGRNQTYQLRGKTPYFAEGEEFLAKSQFLAGLPPTKATLPNPDQQRWNPRELLASNSPIDQFVAVKALGVVGNRADLPAITAIAEADPEGRVALEAAATLIRLGDNNGIELLRSAIENPQIVYLRMESFLALSEFHGTELASSCAELLAEYASNEVFAGDEVRQAAIWGLGKDGLRDYVRLLEFLDVPSDEERVHAVCAFGSDSNTETVDELVSILTNPDSSDRKIAGASYILAKIVPARLSAPRLVQIQNHASQRTRHWVIATLGQMSPTSIRLYVNNPDLAAQLVPFQLTSEETNWTCSEQITEMLTFVRKQTIAPTP